jgi:solute:Na+ symporter, SSS family
MAVLDWIIVALSLLASVGIGLYFSKRATASKDDYLLAGRSLGWFIAGTSIVATTFSSDTPLFVARISRQSGIFENWWWWSGAIGQLAAVFFFARLWRRSEVTTDVEFIARRYDEGRPARALRVFRAVFDGVLINCTIVASVTLGMVKILTTVLRLGQAPAFALPIIGSVSWPVVILVILSVLTLAYCTVSGLYGVVYTDVFQFLFAMVGCIALAVIVYVDAAGGAGMLHKLSAAPQFKQALLNFVPQFGAFDITTFTFVVYLGMVWWFQVPSGGFYVQRLLATRNENEAAKAFLWYNFCQYVLRPWPWIIVGLLSLIYFPDLNGPAAETAYPAMVRRFLPVGLLGVMVAALMAAYRSTVSTHLHLGVSYLVNDIYQPFVAPGRSQRHYVAASQVGMVLLTIAAALIVTQLKGIMEAYKFLFVYWVGMGTVLMGRWYWWRVNAWSEISALAGSAFMLWSLHTTTVAGWITSACTSAGLLLPGAADPDIFGPRVVIATVFVTAVWVVVTLATTSSEPSVKTVQFYQKLRVGGPGWSRVARAARIQPVRGELAAALRAWVVSLVWLYSLLLGIGKLVLQEWLPGSILLAIGLITSELLRRMLLRQKMMQAPPPAETPAAPQRELELVETGADSGVPVS